MVWKLFERSVLDDLWSCQQVFMSYVSRSLENIEITTDNVGPSTFLSPLPLCIYGNSGLGLKTFRHLMSAIKIALLECKYSSWQHLENRVLEKLESKSCNFPSFFISISNSNYNFVVTRPVQSFPALEPRVIPNFSMIGVKQHISKKFLCFFFTLGQKSTFYPEITKNLMFEKCEFCEK